MTEQEILNKVKESADLIEIPKHLKPEQVELRLQQERKKQHKKFYWQAKHLVAAAFVLVCLLALLPIQLQKGGMTEDITDDSQNGQEEVTVNHSNMTEEPLKRENAGELYVIAANYEEVYDYMKEYTSSIYKYEAEIGVKEEAAEEMFDSMADGAVNSPISEMPVADLAYSESSLRGEAKTLYSKTNVQMAGVDESDIVKTNGTHIFLVTEGNVEVAEVKNGEMKKVGRITPPLQSFSDEICEMYVDGDKLLLIVQQREELLENAKLSGKEETVKEKFNVCVDIAYCYDSFSSTVIYTYDISNPTNPKQIGKIQQDGGYKTSRKIGDILYLFTEDMISMDTEEDLPAVNGETIAADCIYLPKSGTHGLIVSSVSLDNPNAIVDNVLILNNYVEIYVSSGAMYLYHSNYENNREMTEIAKFSLEKGIISAKAAAAVPGRVRDTFAVNEYKGNLRMLTTEWDSDRGEQTNQLYILDSSLKKAGSIEDIANGEEIYAARYFGNLAYFITYRNTDPLFAADLSNINEPKILGELEITGYSEYLHPWGEDKLLGIGYETNPKNGRIKGIKLVMFDISNPAELSILDTVVLEGKGYSAALYYYKSVLADESQNIIGFTTREDSEYEIDYRIYSFEDGEFHKKLVIDVEEEVSEKDCRGLYIGDYFYFVNELGITSYHRMDEYKKVNELRL